MFVRTEDNKKVEVKNMVFVSVEPDSAFTNIWQLLVKTYNEKGKFTGDELIAKFDSVQKANAAKSSLEQAYYQCLGWDAIEYHREN